MTAIKPASTVKSTSTGFSRPASVHDLQNLCVFHSLLPHDAQIRLKRASTRGQAKERVKFLQAATDLIKMKYPEFFRDEEEGKK